jgi:hypothetical protein
MPGRIYANTGGRGFTGYARRSPRVGDARVVAISHAEAAPQTSAGSPFFAEVLRRRAFCRLQERKRGAGENARKRRGGEGFQTTLLRR